MTVKITKPEINLREELTKALCRPQYQEQEFYFTGDAVEVAFGLPSGWKPKYVFVDGSKTRINSAEGFTIVFDGFTYSVVFAVAPGSGAEVDIIGVLS